MSDSPYTIGETIVCPFCKGEHVVIELPEHPGVPTVDCPALGHDPTAPLKAM